jgi:hypothetical protein
MIDFAGAAITRLGYLYPRIVFGYAGNAISAVGEADVGEQKIRKDVLYAVYREKIYAETLDMRRSLIATVSEG